MIQFRDPTLAEVQSPRALAVEKALARLGLKPTPTKVAFVLDHIDFEGAIFEITPAGKIAKNGVDLAPSELLELLKRKVI